MSKKIAISIILIILVIFTINIPHTYAANTLKDVLSGGKSFIDSGSGGSAKLDETKLQQTSSTVYNILLVASFVIVAVVGIILGIKYMWAGVEEKADVKKSLTIFVIGTIVTYGAFGIWKVLVNFLNTSGL